MKVNVNEHGGCFSINLEPETIAEAALLIRLGINGTKEVRSLSAYASGDNTISACVVIGKHKKPSSQVAKGKW